MIAVIFEVKPTAEGKEEYLNVAKEMSEFLKDREGLISIERFQSFVDEGKVLSLSFWENVESITQWRNQMAHEIAVESGIESCLFKSYRIRMAEVIQDYEEVIAENAE